MRTLLTYLMFLGIFCNYSLQAQSTATPILVGQLFSFPSKILEEDRQVRIFLPPGYDTLPDRKYPVMYVLDGQEYFLQPIMYQEMLRFKEKSPDFIVVGLDSKRRPRRQWYAPKSDLYIDFLRKELIPYIDSTYQTLKSQERLFFGWEMAAGLGVEILADHPQLFSALMLASPTHLTKKRLAAVDSLLQQSDSLSTFIYCTYAPDEDHLLSDLHYVDSLFARYPIGQQFKIDLLNGEDHYTTAAKTIHNGLRSYFLDYNPVRIFSLEDLEKFGGLALVKAYYQRRGERYGVDRDVHKTSKHFILLSAMESDQPDLVDAYNQELGQYLETGMRYDFWFNRYVRFFLKHQRYQRAKSLLDIGIKKYPQSKLLYTALGDYFGLMGKPKQSAKAKAKAAELGQ